MNRQTSATRTWTEPELEQAASAITFGVLLACIAEFGVTRTAFAAAYAAVALTDAIEEEPAGAPGS